MKSEKRTIAAVTAALAAYIEAEEKATMPVAIPQMPAMVASLWTNYEREEIMQVFWQRRIVARVTTFGYRRDSKH